VRKKEEEEKGKQEMDQEDTRRTEKGGQNSRLV
jgi:hypothetical protein